MVAAYDILLFYEQFTTVGLSENMVYDIIPTIPAAVGTTTVNASVFDVECTALPYASQATQETLESAGINVMLSIFNVDQSGPQATFPLACASKRCYAVMSVD